jgi:Glutathione S-transferase N-terminal domain
MPIKYARREFFSPWPKADFCRVQLPLPRVLNSLAQSGNGLKCDGHAACWRFTLILNCSALRTTTATAWKCSLRLCHLPFHHAHILDASAAPRGQLPYIIDDGETVGDSDTIIAYLTSKYHLTLDNGLTATQRDLNHLITCMLDDLYLVMSYSRWKDERYWPTFGILHKNSA